MQNKLSDSEIKEFWTHLVRLHPQMAHLPNLGFNHLKRCQDMPANSILVSYVLPDRKTTVFNETTEDEMREQGITPTQALRNSLVAMKHLCGTFEPGRFLHHTLPANSPYIAQLSAIWNER